MKKTRRWEPDNGEVWLTTVEAAARLGMERGPFLTLAKRLNLVTYRAGGGAISGYYLQREIESMADFRELRRDWWRKHRNYGQPRTTQKIDPALAKEVFITVEKAAAMLGVARDTVYKLVSRGILCSYQAKPGQKGSRQYFSPTAVAALARDPERCKRREAYLNRKAKVYRPQSESGGWGRGKQPLYTLVKSRQKGWVTTRQAAEILDCSPSAVRGLHRRGRFRGKQLWKDGKPLPYWYFEREDIEEFRDSEGYRENRAEYERSLVTRAKLKMGHFAVPAQRVKGPDEPLWANDLYPNPFR